MQKAKNLVEEISTDEMNVPISYDKDDINQAIKHTREDVIGLYSMMGSILKQVHIIKYLLICILLISIYLTSKLT